MSMKKWTDEELVSTRDNLETWNKRNNNLGSGPQRLTKWLQLQS